MARVILKDVTVLGGDSGTALDLSGHANQVSLSQSVERLDATTFADLVRRYVGGRLDSQFSLTALGQDDAADPRATIHDMFADDTAVLMFVESNASMAEADYCIFGQVLPETFDLSGEGGAIQTVSLSGNGANAMVMGQILQPDVSAISSTSTSTGFQMSSTVSATQRMWATQICIASSGSPTLDTIVQSDDNSGFTSATNQITFSQITGKIAQFSSKAGAIADDYWRVSYTFGGTGSITVAVAIGIY